MGRFNLAWLAIIFISGSLQAGIEQYFKSAENKSGCYFNQLDNLDFIYTINLDQRPEKFEHCLRELAPYGIRPYRFSAVNGWELSLEALNNLGVKYRVGMPTDLWGSCYLPEGNFEPHHEVMQVVGRNYFSHCLSRGAIGIVLSHLSVLQDAFDSGYQTIWVMEDDIQVIQNPHQISRLIEDLDHLVGNRGWDLLFTDQDTKDNNGKYVSCSSYARRPDFFPAYPARFGHKKEVGNQFRKVGARYGAYSMIVRRSGMKKILNFLKKHKIFLPYDMEFSFPNDIHMYTVIHDVVSTQPGSLSDNGGQNYKK